MRHVALRCEMILYQKTTMEGWNVLLGEGKLTRKPSVADVQVSQDAE